MRDIDHIIIHAADTPPEMDVGAEEIRDWHVNGNGWRDIGYHWVIRRNGEVEPGREESVVGAHVAGHNANSIGVCLVGGRGPEGGDDCNYTAAQWRALERLVGEISERYPEAAVKGHRDFSSKACPCFDAAAWWGERSAVEPPSHDKPEPSPVAAPASDSGSALLLGGVRSGKSAWAQRLASRSGQAVRVIVTATADDEEMAARIARHQADRPDDWTVVEEPTALADAVRDAVDSGDCLLIDCLSLWLSNLLQAEDTDESQIEQAIQAFCEALDAYAGPVIIVSNEVGLGGVQMNELARRYADELGRLNQCVAARCQHVYLSVAGKLLAVKGELPSGDSLHAGED